MSDMKCPFCNGELVGTIGHPICRNQDCVMCDDPMPQELLELLNRTRKALDAAVDALKRANNTYCAEEEDITIDLTESSAHKWQRTAYQMEMPISIALEQITALEQKDK